MPHASTLLREWLKREGMNQREGADYLGMHYTFLNKILLRQRNPSLSTAVRIERATGVPVQSW